MIVQVSSQTPPTARELLLAPPRYLFWEKGYAATGVAELLQRAHVNSGSFYHVFPSKEALLLAVLEDYLGGLEPAVMRSAYGCPIGRLALEIEAETLPAHNRIAANSAAWTTAVRACLEAVRDRLPLHCDLDALATFVLTVMEGGVMQARSYRRMEPFDQSIAQLRSYFQCLLAQQAQLIFKGKRKRK